MTCKAMLFGVVAGLLLQAGVAAAEDCKRPPEFPDAELVQCLRHGGLQIVLTRENQGGTVLVLRMLGGGGETFSDGEIRLLFEEVVGEAPGEVLIDGEPMTMAVVDAPPGGPDELVVASLVPVNGAERKLQVISLNPDMQEFGGAIFFRHAPGHGEDTYLGVPFPSEVSVGDTVRVVNADGSLLEYAPADGYTFALVRDTRPGREYDAAQ